MRALVVSTYSPLRSPETTTGAVRRLGVFLAAIGDVSDAVEILFFGHPDEIDAAGGRVAVEAAHSAKLGCPVRITLIPLAHRRETLWRHYGAGVLKLSEQPHFHHYAANAQVDAVRESLDRHPDLVFVSRLAAMSAVLRSGCSPARMFFDLDDVEHAVRLRTILAPPRWPSKLAYGLQVPAMLVAERRSAARSERVFVCSDRDRRTLLRLGFGRKVTVVPNGIEMPPLAACCGDQSLLFLGNYSYRPNLDAAERLVARIWPLVRAKVPGARLVIAGLHASRIPSFADGGEGVTFCGFVEDLSELYGQVRVVACPITVGGGTRVKLIEAAAYGKPMVATRIGAEGLDFTDGRDIVLRDRDDEFADACVHLLEDDEACRDLGAAARTKAAALYDATRIRQDIGAILQGVAAA